MREREIEYFTKCRFWCMWSVFVFFGKLLCQLDRARVCSNSQEILKKKKKRTFVTLFSLSLPLTHTDHESWNLLSEAEGLVSHVIVSFSLRGREFDSHVSSWPLPTFFFPPSKIILAQFCKVSLSVWILCYLLYILYRFNWDWDVESLL